MSTGVQPPASPPAGASEVGEVLALWQRVAEERGLHFEPAPRGVAAAVPGLLRAIGGVSAGLSDAQERRWLAALLAAFSHRVQESTRSDPGEVDRSDGDRWSDV